MKSSYVIMVNGTYLLAEDHGSLVWSSEVAGALRFDGPKQAQSFADDHVSGSVKIVRLEGQTGFFMRSTFWGGLIHRLLLRSARVSWYARHWFG